MQRGKSVPGTYRFIQKRSSLSPLPVFIESDLLGSQIVYEHDRSVHHRDKVKTQEHLYWVNMLTSNLKRFLLSTYHGVGRKYREAYLEEFAYRFNRRYWPTQAFDRLLYACVIADPVTLPEVKA